MFHDKFGTPIDINDFLVIPGSYSTLIVVQVERFNLKTVVCVPVDLTKKGKKRKSTRVYAHESVKVNEVDVAMYKLNSAK